MRLNKKISALIVMLFLGAMATQVIAQPSIPRRYSTTKSKKKTRTSSSSTVWGTQYDWLGQRYATWNDIKYRCRTNSRAQELYLCPPWLHFQGL